MGLVVDNRTIKGLLQAEAVRPEAAGGWEVAEAVVAFEEVAPCDQGGGIGAELGLGDDVAPEQKPSAEPQRASGDEEPAGAGEIHSLFQRLMESELKIPGSFAFAFGTSDQRYRLPAQADRLLSDLGGVGTRRTRLANYRLHTRSDGRSPPKVS